MQTNFDVLDHGYVHLTGTLVSMEEDVQNAQTLDEMVVTAARVSNGAGLKGSEKDRKLLHYLIEHEHGTPFESAVLKFEVKCPIFVMRQWIRHRWSSFNEISGRYTEEISEEFYVPNEMRAQDEKNKQGSIKGEIKKIGRSESYRVNPWDAEAKDPEAGWRINYLSAKDAYSYELHTQKKVYDELIEAGVARELARGILGVAFYTKFVWTVNARSLMNFLILRLDLHAQWEIRQYAIALVNIFSQVMPWTYKSLITLFPSSFGDFQPLTLERKINTIDT